MMSKDDPLLTTDLPFIISESGINAYVSSALGVTINLGNFESLRVDASVSLPCYPDSKNISLARSHAEELLTKELFDNIRSIKENTRSIQAGIHQELEGSNLLND